LLVNNFLLQARMDEIHFSIIDLGIKIDTTQEAFNYAIELGLQPSTRSCNTCHKNMKLAKKGQRFVFLCCRKRVSCYTNTFLGAGSHLSWKNLLLALFSFCKEESNKVIQNDAKIKGKEHVANLLDSFRQVNV
jgi:hypothetical protein